jgi:hypothetical protein
MPRGVLPARPAGDGGASRRRPAIAAPPPRPCSAFLPKAVGTTNFRGRCFRTPFRDEHRPVAPGRGSRRRRSPGRGVCCEDEPVRRLLCRLSAPLLLRPRSRPQRSLMREQRLRRRLVKHEPALGPKRKPAWKRCSRPSPGFPNRSGSTLERDPWPCSTRTASPSQEAQSPCTTPMACRCAIWASGRHVSWWLHSSLRPAKRARSRSSTRSSTGSSLTVSCASCKRSARSVRPLRRIHRLLDDRVQG